MSGVRGAVPDGGAGIARPASAPSGDAAGGGDSRLEAGAPGIGVGAAARRAALIDATMQLTAAIGYEAATVTEITAAAGCSRRAFNRHFRDKDEAFEVGYREISGQMWGVVQAAYDAHEAPIRRTRAALAALAAFLAADPRRAELLVIHGHSAGQATVGIRTATMRRVVELILDATRGLPRGTGDPRLVAEIVAGGISEVVFTRTLRGQTRSLPDLVPEWSRAVIAPYVAIAAAADAGR